MRRILRSFRFGELSDAESVMLSHYYFGFAHAFVVLVFGALFAKVTGPNILVQFFVNVLGCTMIIYGLYRVIDVATELKIELIKRTKGSPWR